jgi:hypothetical protein
LKLLPEFEAKTDAIGFKAPTNGMAAIPFIRSLRFM